MTTKGPGWTTPKLIAAPLALVILLVLITPLPDVLMSMVLAPVLFTGLAVILAGVLLACVVILHRELASLKITVVLLTLGLFLVYAGTIAQTRLGIWVVINDYFRSLGVMIPVKMLLTPFSGGGKPMSWPYIMFPGGFMILGLLSVNLMCAMGKKIASDWKSSARGRLLRRHMGIYILHVGLVVMFAGEFVTGLSAKEGRMTITVGGWSDYVEDHMETELVFLDSSAPEEDRHVVIPEALLVRHAGERGGGEVISHPDLPFDVRVDDYLLNTKFSERASRSAFRGAGALIGVEEIPRWPGTEGLLDIPSVVVTLIDKADGQPIGTWICAASPDQLKLNPELSGALDRPEVVLGQGLPDQLLALPMSGPQTVAPGMPTMQLRMARRYMEYRVYLDQVEHDVYDGTGIPHNFSSDVRVVDKATGDERKSHIWMNHPLRYEDETYYQHQMDAGAGLTGLMVVNNKGVWLPYISCAIVTLGMLVQFTVSLVGYGRRSMR